MSAPTLPTRAGQDVVSPSTLALLTDEQPTHPTREQERASELRRQDELTQITLRIRRHILRMCATPDGGHVGGSMSLVEILTSLYFRVLEVDPARPQDPSRDVLLLSKGHGALCLYATLAEAGFLGVDDLEDYGRPGSHFLAHPHPGIPGIEMPSGSLGHGLALGIGFAISMRLERSDRRCFVVMGDGELQEGSVWEAAAVASHRRLPNLTAVIDRNGMQISGSTESVNSQAALADRWRAFGWTVREVDGHDIDALTEALTAPAEYDRPTAVIAHTTKGKGVPMIEGQARSHFAKLGRRQYERALDALLEANS